ASTPTSRSRSPQANPTPATDPGGNTVPSGVSAFRRHRDRCSRVGGIVRNRLAPEARSQFGAGGFRRGWLFGDWGGGAVLRIAFRLGRAPMTLARGGPVLR